MPENDRYLGKNIHENNYCIRKKLGQGGFGTAYLADHRHLEKQMVIKFLENVNPLLSDKDEAEAFERIREEGNILQGLQHRNIMHIEDIGIFEKCVPYLILPYAAQGTLRQKMRPSVKPLSLEESLTIIEQAGEALQYMHEHGVVHGDVKPENMLFDGKGTLLLADMGNAAVLTAMQTAPHPIGGTPPYMAPEQFEDMIDSRSDQYALGCVAYELLTGKLPVTMDGSEQQGESLLSTVASEQDQPLVQVWLRWAMQHIQTRPQRPSKYNPTLSLPIELAILKALAKKPEDRHPDVATFVQALQSYDPSKYQRLKEEWVQEGDRLCREQRYPEALAVYRWVKQFAVHNPEVDRRIAQVYLKLGQDEQARSICEQIVHFAPGDVQTLLLQAELFYRAGDFRQTRAVCERVLRLAPKDQGALSDTARMFYQLQQWPEALTACEQLLQLVPSDLSVLKLKIATLYQLQRYQEVLATCKDVLRLLPEDQEVRWYKMDALSKWGHILFERKQYQEAGESYEQAVRLGTYDSTTWYHRGRIFSEKRDYEAALASYKRAWQLSESCESERETMIAISIGMAETLWVQAKALRKQGRKVEANQVEEQAAQFDRARQSLFLT